MAVFRFISFDEYLLNVAVSFRNLRNNQLKQTQDYVKGQNFFNGVFGCTSCFMTYEKMCPGA